MTDAAPPSWVKRAPGLSAAHKFMLGVLWGYGPYAGRDELWMDVDGDRQPRQPVLCWESCAELAKLTDQPEATVRNQLRKLAADGWILRGPGSMRTLAWREPRRFAYGALANDGRSSVTDGQVPTTGDPGHERPPDRHSWTGGDHECTPRVATGGPQTLQEHSNSTSRNTPPGPRARDPEDAHERSTHPTERGPQAPRRRRPAAPGQGDRDQDPALGAGLWPDRARSLDQDVADPLGPSGPDECSERRRPGQLQHGKHQNSDRDGGFEAEGIGDGRPTADTPSGLDSGARSESHERDTDHRHDTSEDQQGPRGRGEAGSDGHGVQVSHAGPAGQQAVCGEDGPARNLPPPPEAVGAQPLENVAPAREQREAQATVAHRRRGRRDDPGDGRGAVADAPAPLRLIPAEADGDAVTELWALHERLRMDALAHHGKPRTKLAKPGSKAARALEHRIRERFDEYGLERCRAVLHARAEEWRRQLSQLGRAPVQTWSDRGFEYVLARLDAAPVRSRPSAGLTAAPATLPLVPRELSSEEMGGVL